MIGFRVDANEQIATGHLMRCIAIAEECIRQGEECLFLLAQEKETERLTEHGILYRVLHTQWDDMESELPVLSRILAEEKFHWLVVDSYQVTTDYLAYLNQRVPVCYIDDRDEVCYPVSALLRYAQWPDSHRCEERYQGTKTFVMAGMQYVPLRQEFQPENNRWDREKSILITTGGTDPYHITENLLLLCLEEEKLKEYQFQVIIGSMNENGQALQELADCFPRISLHRNVRNMSEYMRRCELAVSAGGTTLFELCACRIPTVCFSFADNQIEGTVEMGNRNVMPYAGDARACDMEQSIVELLLQLAEDETLRQGYAARMGQLIDGKGAARIGAVLCGEAGQKKN